MFKKATKFFDTTGSVLKTVSQEAFKNATKAISKSIKSAVGSIKNAEGKLIKITSAEFLDYTAKYKEKLKLLKAGVKQISRIASKVLNAALNIAKKKAELVKCALKINKKKRKKCKSKVNAKYDKDTNSDSCADYEYKYTGYISNEVKNIRNFNIGCNGVGFIKSAALEKKDNSYRFRYSCSDVPNSNTCYTKASTSGSSNLSLIDAWANTPVECKEDYGLSYLKWQNSSGNPGFTYVCCKLNNRNIGCQEEEGETFNINDNNLDTIVDEELAPSDNSYIRSFTLKKLGKEELVYKMKSCKINALVLTKKDTGCLNEDSGNIFTLLNHEVKCGNNEFIHYFNFKRENGNTHYVYDCIYNHTMTNNCQTKLTFWDDTYPDKYKSIMYLDRHNVACPDNTLMRSFKLQQNGTKIRYNYTCCEAPIKQCTDLETPWGDTDKGRVYFLDKMKVDAEGRRGINRFKLWRHDDDIKYKYRACNL